MNEYIGAFVDELYELGVEDMVISPGSRSTPVAMYACASKLNVYLNIDERSAAFFALGIAKAKNKAVAVLCTSGSAVAHYLPAAIEAKYSRVPLLFLSADRPAEFQGIGAAQTIDQCKILGEYVKYYEELSALPEGAGSSSASYARQVVQKAYVQAMSSPKGAVQINIPLSDPLVPSLEEKHFAEARSSLAFHYSEGERGGAFDASFFAHKKGLIICGGDAFAQYQEDIIALAEKLKAPLLADPLSSFRQYENHCIIDSYDAFLKDDTIKEDLVPEYILLFGQAPVSKRVYQFLNRHPKVFCLQIDDVAEYRNPVAHTASYICMSPKNFAKTVDYVASDDSYLKKWQYYQNIMRATINKVQEETELFEGKIIQKIQNTMPEKSYFCVANSMSIRDIDFFWQAKKQDIQIYCNRGSNGIDGTISTALGVASLGKPTVLLTGDLSFFHDMNGLLVGKTHNINLVIILLNNDGGGIFQYLPQCQAPYFDYLFSTEHGLKFSALQELYGIKHHAICSYETFDNLFPTVLNQDGIHILELCYDKANSKKIHSKYVNWQE